MRHTSTSASRSGGLLDARHGRRAFLGGAAGLVGAAAYAAYGGALASAFGPRPKSSDLTTATIGFLPITDVAPFFLGQSLGYFEEEGLQIEHTFAAGGAVILPSVESGEFDIGYSNIVSLLLIQSRGGKYKLIAGGGKTAMDDERDYSEMWVLNDSELESLADVGGKTVAINTLSNALEIVVRKAADEAGADHESINFVEIPFPEMGAALESGEVDAIQYNEPFQTILEQNGTARSIGKAFNVAAGGEILAYYFVKEENIDGPVATGFSAAMAKANAYAAEHEQELRDIITTYTEVPQEIADALIMPTYVEESVPESSLQVYAELMTEYGLVDELPDFAALLPEA
jgi:NitT/TauT family transport system substrate-binding protein